MSVFRRRHSSNSSVTHHGPGPFVTRVTRVLEDGRHRVATSRRYRKGLAAHVVAPAASARIPPSRAEAFRHFWAPARLGWWVAVVFIVGSSLFAVGGWGATWPASTPPVMRSAAVLNWILFIGSLFFTTAAYLQLLEATNGDVADALAPQRPAWRWFGWKPHNLGWCASVIQLVGTVFFNFNTADAMLAGLDWGEQDLLIWSPNMLGCACFLASSALAWVELSGGAASFAPRSASWWSVVLNGLGSIAFQLSAVHAFVRPGTPDPNQLWLAGFWTFVGALCFLLGSYLLIPELFDGEARDAS
jgi:hypothetical protein